MSKYEAVDVPFPASAVSRIVVAEIEKGYVYNEAALSWIVAAAKKY